MSSLYTRLKHPNLVQYWSYLSNVQPLISR